MDPYHAKTEQLLSRLAESRIVGVLRSPTAEAAVQAALVSGRAGLRAIEVMFTTPGAPDALRRLRDELPSGTLLGAGTILNAAHARQAAAANVDFLTSPHLGEDVLDAAQGLGLPYLPGVLTPTEVTKALALGAVGIKLFPAGASGNLYLRELFGPFPDLRVLVTGGITPDQVPSFIRSGAFAVGLGSYLFPRSLLESGDWTAVEGLTKAALVRAREI
ncbi:MAG TPA: bifunctional 4-hydroxy-2-oxoglutarate aldolase/2-dehydro-3-deoxy-phosphogluconate aldolase [Deinococcales bacterium]|nr:bifunctional 4-hydroxy-2-oxoglutarate aldolase/2-dehydro-3-deoxy-phosphogluconate aldolase [Deinococcales bacterium]